MMELTRRMKVVLLPVFVLVVFAGQTLSSDVAQTG
jgi:hypothetical protein